MRSIVVILIIILLLIGCSNSNNKLDQDNVTNNLPIDQLATPVIKQDEAPIPTPTIHTLPLETIASTENFKLKLPVENDVVSIKRGISFHAEIHKLAIGKVDVEIIDSDGKIVKKFEKNHESFFDDGVYHEWNDFAMRIRFEDEEPKGKVGIFRIIDHLSGEKIEIKLLFTP